MKSRRTGRRGPVVLAQKPGSLRRNIRARDGLLGADALESPLPGQLLILLSRLHRTERGAGPDEEERRG